MGVAAMRHIIYRKKENVDLESLTTERLEELLRWDLEGEAYLPPETSLEILKILDFRT